ncbi:hypothetical protein FE251_13115 [Georgenia wutianyii]|uniref:SipW-cognate class signal peptide n=1 Tax=Georgenia wutianyii TaxID=2585135 RepID=A0ABX5VTG5_9MICO|nr:hypothetical protein [Georgenia wutianyii]QDB80215.1 hypothetical protein FE251_13115 [Georgenia wutianyii]
MRTSRRARRTLAVTAVALAGGAVGIGGVSLALWGDSERVTGAVADGYELFAVGAPGATTPTPAGTATFVVGPEAAAALARDGEVAVPIQVDSVSQGNKGLHYVLTPPQDWGGNLLGAADVAVFRVDTAAACSTDALAPGDPHPAGPWDSTPVPATYSTTTTPVTEYWCVYAAYDGPPVTGEYENTATVTATSPDGRQVTDEDSWNAVLVAGLDPAAEPDHEITLTYTTFRPGEEP